MIDFKIAYSPFTVLVLCALHLLSAIAVVLSQLPPFITLVLQSLVLMSASLMLEDYGKHSRNRLRRCLISDRGSKLTSARESLCYGLPRCVFLGEYLLVLEFEPPRPSAQKIHKRRLLLTVEALSPADFCRLQRYLRFEI